MPSNYFRQTRDCELSLIYFLETELATDWTEVTVNVVKSFSKAYASDLPVVCVRVIDAPRLPLEVGSTSLRRQFNIIIDIFARSDGERLDLSDYIVDKIKSGWIFYEHSQNAVNNRVLDRTANGRVTSPRYNENRRVDFSETVEKYDKYRHLINVNVEKW